MVAALSILLVVVCICEACGVLENKRLRRDLIRLEGAHNLAELTLRLQSADVGQYLATIEELRQKIAEHAEEIMQLRCIDEKREKIDLLQRERLEMARASLDAIAGSAKDSLSKLPI